VVFRFVIAVGFIASGRCAFLHAEPRLSIAPRCGSPSRAKDVRIGMCLAWSHLRVDSAKTIHRWILLMHHYAARHIGWDGPFAGRSYGWPQVEGGGAWIRVSRIL